MILDNFPEILWINLNRSTTRKNYMEKLLNDHGLNHTRISAVDGMVKNNPEFVNFCKKNTTMTDPENACTCSHIKALLHFINNTKLSEVIIFEDDIDFCFLDFIPYDWSTFIKHIPENYHVVQLAVTMDEGSPENYLVKSNTKGTHYCSAAYLISRIGAMALLKEYYVENTFTVNLKDKIHATADAIITNTSASYSIPIFTYQLTSSIIHPRHLHIHRKSKIYQYKMWKALKETGSSFNEKDYFSKFAK